MDLLGRVFEGVKRGVAELRSSLGSSVTVLVVVYGLFLGEVGEVHGGTVVILAVEALLGVRALLPILIAIMDGLLGLIPCAPFQAHGRLI
jgi:hypothetical protein